MFSRPGRGRKGRLSQVLRPMMQGLPIVTALKRCRSERSRQGRSPSRPMTPLRARATTRAMWGRAKAVLRSESGATRHRSRSQELGVRLEQLQAEVQTADHRADGWCDEEDPDLAQGLTPSQQRRAEAARRVDRNARHLNADDVDDRQGDADGHARE